MCVFLLRLNYAKWNVLECERRKMSKTYVFDDTRATSIWCVRYDFPLLSTERCSIADGHTVSLLRRCNISGEFQNHWNISTFIHFSFANRRESTTLRLIFLIGNDSIHWQCRRVNLSH